MRFFVSNFKWIMLISGLLTCIMFLALLSPQASIKSNFGTTIDQPVAEMIVRNWGALIGMIGIMLIYGSFVLSVRKFSLVIAGISKAIFIILILLPGEPDVKLGAATAVIADSIMIVLFVAYLLFSPTHD